MVKLAGAALVALLAESGGQRFVVGEDHEVPCFQHVSKVIRRWPATLCQMHDFSAAQCSSSSRRMREVARCFEYVVVTLHTWP